MKRDMLLDGLEGEIDKMRCYALDVTMIPPLNLILRILRLQEEELKKLRRDLDRKKDVY